MKKLLLGLGTIATVIIPTITVISCGESVTPAATLTKEQTGHAAILPGKTAAKLKTAAAQKIKDHKKLVKNTSMKLLIEEMMKHSIANLKDEVDQIEGTGPLATAEGIDSIKKAITEYKGILTLIHDILTSGIKSTFGTEDNFIAKVKELFNTDLTDNPFLPLIKAITFGIKDIENFHMKPIELMGFRINIETLIKNIYKHGLAYALYQDKTLTIGGYVALPFLKIFIETGTLNNPEDLAKFKLFYGEEYVKFIKDSGDPSKTPVIPTSGGVFSNIFKHGLLGIAKSDLTTIQKFFGEIANPGGLLDFILSKISPPVETGTPESMLKKISPIFSKLLKLFGLRANNGHEEISSLIISVLNGGVAQVETGDIAAILRLIRELSITHEFGTLSYIPIHVKGRTIEDILALFKTDSFSKVPEIIKYLEAETNLKNAIEAAKVAIESEKAGAILLVKQKKQDLQIAMRNSIEPFMKAIIVNNNKFADSLVPSAKDMKIASLIHNLFDPSTVIGEISSHDIIEVVKYFYDIVHSLSIKYEIPLPVILSTAVVLLESLPGNQKIKDLIVKFYPIIFA